MSNHPLYPTWGVCAGGVTVKVLGEVSNNNSDYYIVASSSLGSHPYTVLQGSMSFTERRKVERRLGQPTPPQRYLTSTDVRAAVEKRANIELYEVVAAKIADDFNAKVYGYANVS